MGFLVIVALLVVVLAVLGVMAFKAPSPKNPELDPEKEGTSYEKPQDEGPV